MSDNVFQAWLEKLIEQGFSEDQIAAILAHETQISAGALYQLISSSLTEEDIQEIEQAQNDQDSDKLVESLFKKRTGMTIEDALNQLRESLMQQQKYSRTK